MELVNQAKRIGTKHTSVKSALNELRYVLDVKKAKDNLNFIVKKQEVDLIDKAFNFGLNEQYIINLKQEKEQSFFEHSPNLRQH